MSNNIHQDCNCDLCRYSPSDNKVMLMLSNFTARTSSQRPATSYTDTKVQLEADDIVDPSSSDPINPLIDNNADTTAMTTYIPTIYTSNNKEGKPKEIIEQEVNNNESNNNDHQLITIDNDPTQDTNEDDNNQQPRPNENYIDEHGQEQHYSVLMDKLYATLQPVHKKKSIKTKTLEYVSSFKKYAAVKIKTHYLSLRTKKRIEKNKYRAY